MDAPLIASVFDDWKRVGFAVIYPASRCSILFAPGPDGIRGSTPYHGNDIEAQIEAFVEHYNHRRYHESLSNLTPADVYFGRGQTILLQRERIKRQTIETRRLQYRKTAA